MPECPTHGVVRYRRWCPHCRVLSGLGPPDANGCRRWQRGRDRKGYGRTRLGGRVVRVHRAVWRLLRGEIPGRLVVCHDCGPLQDYPDCGALQHLWLGTTGQNVRDGLRKQRRRRAVDIKYTGALAGNP